MPTPITPSERAEILAELRKLAAGFAATTTKLRQSLATDAGKAQLPSQPLDRQVRDRPGLS